jgi:hypothetical protein
MGESFTPETEVLTQANFLDRWCNMATMKIRVPNDRHERLRQLAKYRGMSVNKLMEEFSTIGLA